MSLSLIFTLSCIVSVRCALKLWAGAQVRAFHVHESLKLVNRLDNMYTASQPRARNEACVITNKPVWCCDPDLSVEPWS